jgi:mycofactocin precursor
VAGGRPGRTDVLTPALWTLLALCANIRAMTTTADSATPTVSDIPVDEVDEVLAEVLVEEISIDGMCGVY